MNEVDFSFEEVFKKVGREVGNWKRHFLESTKELVNSFKESFLGKNTETKTGFFLQIKHFSRF